MNFLDHSIQWLSTNWFALIIAITSIFGAITARRSSNAAKRSAKAAEDSLKKENIEGRNLVAAFKGYLEQQHQMFLHSSRVVFLITRSEVSNNAVFIEFTNKGGVGQVYTDIIERSNKSTTNLNYDIKMGETINHGDTFKLTVSLNTNYHESIAFNHFKVNRSIEICTVASNGMYTRTVIGTDQNGEPYVVNHKK